jgi:hypothetical protein
MEVKERRTILGSLGALLAVPFLLGRDTVLRTFAAEAKPKAPTPPKITPPAHSVKRRG